MKITTELKLFPQILKQINAVLSISNYNIDKAFLYLCRNDHPIYLISIEYVLQNGADVNYNNNEAINYSTRVHLVGLTKLLLKYGSNRPTIIYGTSYEDIDFFNEVFLNIK